MTIKTIKVEGFFSEQVLTVEEYVKQWTDHIQQLHRLSSKPEDYEFFVDTIKRVERIAIEEFNRTYEEQNRRFR